MLEQGKAGHNEIRCVIWSKELCMNGQDAVHNVCKKAPWAQNTKSSQTRVQKRRQRVGNQVWESDSGKKKRVSRLE